MNERYLIRKYSGYIFIIGFLIMLIGWFTVCFIGMNNINDTIILIMSLCTCVPFFALGEYIRSSFYITYTDTEIRKQFGNIIYKRILYENVYGIQIAKAYTLGYGGPFPIKKSKKQRIAMALYDSPYPCIDISPRYKLFPVRWRDLGKGAYYICCDFFKSENIMTILDNSEVQLFVSQDVLELNNEDLADILSSYEKRVMVSVYAGDNTDKYKLISYSGINQ